jgi:hypothetical protein
MKNITEHCHTDIEKLLDKISSKSVDSVDLSHEFAYVKDKILTGGYDVMKSNDLVDLMDAYMDDPDNEDLKSEILDLSADIHSSNVINESELGILDEYKDSISKYEHNTNISDIDQEGDVSFFTYENGGTLVIVSLHADGKTFITMNGEDHKIDDIEKYASMDMTSPLNETANKPHPAVVYADELMKNKEYVIDSSMGGSFTIKYIGEKDGQYTFVGVTPYIKGSKYSYTSDQIPMKVADKQYAMGEQFYKWLDVASNLQSIKESNNPFSISAVKIKNMYPSIPGKYIREMLNESLKFKDLVGTRFGIEIGSGIESGMWGDTDELTKNIENAIRHYLFDGDFYYNWTDEKNEYKRVFDEDVMKPLLKNIDKTLNDMFIFKGNKLVFNVDSPRNWIDNWFQTNKSISSSLKKDYYDYRDEYAGVILK